ncbi:MAG: hypothetical protein QOH49_3852 [Acidobacteriota bacterium]|jgi:hypothetical protein|nr:hypothetical protein [Acidobacteriota bacterium]
MSKTRFYVAVELAAVALVAAGVWWLKSIVWGFKAPVGDGLVYLAMAGGGEVAPPWSFHILTPRLAGLLCPRNPAAGFVRVAGVSFVGTAVIVDILLRKVGLNVSLGERALGVALFMATCTGAFMFRGYFLADSLSYFLLAAACAASLYRRDGLVALVTAVGIFNRESALFVIPVWLALNFRLSTPAVLLRRLVLVFTPAAVAYVLLHHTPLFLGREPGHFNYLRPDNIAMIWRGNLSWLGTENVYYGLAICVFLAYGPVWLVAARGLLSVLKGIRRKPVPPVIALWGLALPVLASLLVVDWRRGFQPLFPALISSAILGVRVMTERSPKYCWHLLAMTTAAAAAATTEAWEFQPIRTPVIIALAIWLSAVIVIRIVTRFGARPRRPRPA